MFKLTVIEVIVITLLAMYVFIPLIQSWVG